MKNIQKVVNEILKEGTFSKRNSVLDLFEPTDKFAVERSFNGIILRISRYRSAPPLTSADPVKIGERLKDDVGKLIDLINRAVKVKAKVGPYVQLKAKNGEIIFSLKVDFTLINKSEIEKLDEIGKALDETAYMGGYER